MERSQRVAATPALVLVASVLVLARGLPGWAYMWSLALAVYGGCKWVSWCGAPRELRGSLKRSAAYLLGWPGMDAQAFLDTGARPTPPGLREWVIPATCTGAGLVALGAAVAAREGWSPLARGWTAMAGIILLLHFGVFGLLSSWWRSRGIDAVALMQRPLAATSVASFWGERWNRAFSDLLRQLWFRERVRRSPGRTLLVAFAISGLVHELVITVPAHGGYGRPTLYFVLQALAILAERSRAARRLGLRRGARGWAYTFVVVALPAPLLVFPPVFVHEVIVPFLDFLGGIPS